MPFIPQANLALRSREALYLRESVNWFETTHLSALLHYMKREVGESAMPKSLIELEQSTQAIYKGATVGRGGPNDGKGSIHELLPILLPTVKRILLNYRRHRVADLEAKIANVSDLEVRTTLEQEIKNTEMFDSENWFSSTKAISTPRLTDYLTLRRAEQILAGANAATIPVKQFDDKFGVLAAPSTLAPEFAYWRAQCELRNVGLALAYFDIDNFKRDFNSKYGETAVDRQCLPVIARAIESHTFSHGTAYHEGGDEFVVLMPNTTRQGAIDFMNALRVNIPTIVFPGIESQAHISVGICYVAPESILTDLEVKKHANSAKTYAKNTGGKDCVVTFRGEEYTEKALVVVAPTHKKTVV